MANRYPYAALHDADGNLLVPLTVDGPRGADRDPFLVESIDLGEMTARDDSSERPNGDGNDDRSQFQQAAAVSIKMTARGNAGHSAGWWLDELAGYCQADSRVYLHVQQLDWDAPRRTLMRGESYPRDLTDPQPEVLFQWKAIEGWLEATTVTEVPLYPVGAATEGISEPWSEPVATVPSYGGEVTPIVYGGKRLTDWWECDVYDITAPVLTNGQGLATIFESSLVIPSGHFARIRPNGPNGAQVLYDGDPDQSLMVHLDFARSSWFPLVKGENQIALTGDSIGPTCHALLRWRDRW